MTASGPTVLWIFALGLLPFATGCSDLLDLDGFSSPPDAGAGATAGAGGAGGAGGASGGAAGGGSGDGGAGGTGGDSPVEAVRVFVSSQNPTGNMNGLTGADTICANRAFAAGLDEPGRYWTAWLSDGSRNAAGRIADQGPWDDVWANRIFDDRDHLISGAGPAHALDLDENGVTRTGEAWTGTNGSGMGTGADCDDWGDGSGLQGTVGALGGLGAFWTQAEPPSTRSCVTGAYLYCFEQRGIQQD